MQSLLHLRLLVLTSSFQLLNINAAVPVSSGLLLAYGTGGTCIVTIVTHLQLVLKFAFSMLEGSGPKKHFEGKLLCQFQRSLKQKQEDQMNRRMKEQPQS
jgi:hypothetical protein